MKVVAIMQARMGSTRLPGKVLKDLLGKPMIWHQLERLKRVSCIDSLVVATSNHERDNAIASEIKKMQGIGLFRGDEFDVLSRYTLASRENQADAIIRVTADCPLIDPGVVEKVLKAYQKESKFVDYASNVIERTYPKGLDTEIFSRAALETTFNDARNSEEREHVTLHIYRNPQKFRLLSVTQERDLSGLRLTVDTPEDFELVRRVYTELYPKKPAFDLNDIVTLLERFPEWKSINRVAAS